MTVETVPAKRRLGVGLVIGIILLPIVFAWFTLRKGHSTGSRIGAFIWLALTVVIGLSSMGDTPGAEPGQAQRSNADETVAAKPAATSLKVGDAVRAGEVEFVITEVTTAGAVGGEYTREQASEGATLVVVSYAVKNVGEKPVSAFSIPNVQLLDPSKTPYDFDLAKTSSYQMEANTNAKAWSDLNPGITTRDAKVFEVAADRFDKATWKVKIGRSTIDLQ